MQVVAKAKVPIIKFVENESNVNFDISFDVPNGPIAAGFVRDLMDTLPPMKPLVLVLKIFLQQRAFNEVSKRLICASFWTTLRTKALGPCMRTAQIKAVQLCKPESATV